jgi:hypothetical protein
MPLLAQVAETVALPSGEEAVFTYWIEDDTGPSTIDDALAFAETFHSDLSADSTFTDLYDSATVFAGYKVSTVDKATGNVISSAVGGSPFGGTHSLGVPLPPQLSVGVTLRTALAGRSDRGRFYMPAPVTTTVSTIGRIGGSTPLTMVTAISNAFADAITVSAALVLVVYSRKLRATHLVNRVEVTDVFDTQRRRRDKLITTRQNAIIP